MSEISVMSQVLNEQIANMKRSIDKFSKVCSKVIEEFGTCTNETGNEVTADEDTISRKQAIDVCFNGWNKDYRAIIEDIKLLPPSPSRQAEPQTTEWLMGGVSYINKDSVYCSKCRWAWSKKEDLDFFEYCPNCGRKILYRGKWRKVSKNESQGGAI